jgi:hypothetical protein
MSNDREALADILQDAVDNLTAAFALATQLGVAPKNAGWGETLNQVLVITERLIERVQREV